jgi:hypothetical protein
MTHSNLNTCHESQSLSMIGGAAQGGSAKPKEEREQIDRQHEQRQDEESPSGAGGSKGTVGGTSNDNRTDQDRASDSRTS